MANPEHLDLLQHGFSAIGRWQAEHDGDDDAYLDFDAADLGGIHLGYGLNLNGASLRTANLRGADLDGVDLRFSDLTEADLSFAKLGGTDLGGAVLDKANLTFAQLRANLSGASLIGADLTNADLSFTNLGVGSVQVDYFGKAEQRRAKQRGLDLGSIDFGRAKAEGANLNSANLVGASLYMAELDKTNFSSAQMRVTLLVDCDLGTAVGLETVQHLGPSSISVATLQLTLRSNGGVFTPAQREFLLATGVSKGLLDYLPSVFVEDPIEFHKCMISYTDVDEPFPTQLFNDLQQKGVKCWKFNQSAVLGRSVWDNINRAIQEYDKVIVVCSEHSLCSPGVLREIERALQKEDVLTRHKANNPRVDADVLFPVRLDNYVLTDWQHSRKHDVVSKVIGDFRDWQDRPHDYHQELSRLISALNPKSWCI